MTITPIELRTHLEQHYNRQEAGNLARIICQEILGQSNVDYYLGKDITLSRNEEILTESILSRLDRCEPIQYIQGFARFLGRSFAVDSNVLIPRPETEELVELMAQCAPHGARLLDIGTGSGCIAVSMALERPDIHVSAWDISEGALRIAQSNASTLGANVRFRLQDVLSPEAVSATTERFDIIVSNPPYIMDSERTEMEAGVLDYEPSLALFVPDNDPLLFYRRIAELGLTLLAPAGELYFEINRAFGQETCRLLEGLGYTGVQLRQDISRNDRIVFGKRP